MNAPSLLRFLYTSMSSSLDSRFKTYGCFWFIQFKLKRTTKSSDMGMIGCIIPKVWASLKFNVFLVIYNLKEYLVQPQFWRLIPKTQGFLHHKAHTVASKTQWYLCINLAMGFFVGHPGLLIKLHMVSIFKKNTSILWINLLSPYLIFGGSKWDINYQSFVWQSSLLV